MRKRPKRLWGRRLRAAAAIAVAQPPPVMITPLHTWQELLTVDRLMFKAVRRGWRLAESRLRRRRVLVAERLRTQLAAQPQPPVRQSSTHDIALDLEALEDEFDEVEINPRDGQLSVVTEPVALEGLGLEALGLGRFRIQLDYHDIGVTDQPYTIDALDPNPAGGGETVHPHVSDRSLCEGEGLPAIRAALAERRVLDFFLLVRQVLQTYNPESAYCRLELWHGVGCVDCGRSVNPDSEDHYRCERCDDDLCDGCLAECDRCGRTVCGSCRRPCPECEFDFCRVCWQAQPAGERRCHACRQTPNPSTTGAHHETTSTTPAGPPPAAADPPPDPVRVGQAPSPA